MIFVHPSSSPLEFNALVFAMLRQWYTPDLPNHTFTHDTWFAIPAIKRESSGSVNYTLINSKIEATSLMLVTEEGRLLRSTGLTVDNKVTEADLLEIKSKAFDISQWEQAHNVGFPYSSMFNPQRIRERYVALHGDNLAPQVSQESQDPVFNRVKRKVQRKPCNCGKPVYIG
jgi:hypothetical protein